MNKKLIAPITTAAIMLAVSVGSTFALFSSKASSKIDINAGRVAVNYDATVSKALSRYEDDEPWDAIANKTETHAATFENGSTADISVESTGAVITLDRLAPMDMIELKVGATNDSNINIKFRYFIKASGDLLPALDLIVDGASLEVPGSSLEFYSAWSSVMTPDVESLFEKSIGIYFPDHGEDDNQYQEKTATLEVGIEAIQGNAEVHDPVDPEPVNEPEEIHSKKPSAAGKSVNMESKTGSQSYIVPFEACDESAEELVLTIIPEEEPTAEVPAGKECLPYDISIEGIKEDNTAEIEARIGIGQGKTNVQVFHDGSLIPSTYVEDEGSVYFKATSFSPYDVVFDAARETGYGFYNSYKVDEGLETEHWVHEITTVSHFRNIVTNEGNTISDQYPGYGDYETVYLIKNDIDFGDSAIWTIDDPIQDFVFNGSLEGINEDITLIGYHLNDSLNDEGNMGIFPMARHASFKNLVLDDFVFQNDAGINCGFFAGQTEDDYYNADRVLRFENIIIKDTCSINSSKSIGSLMGLARGCFDFEAKNVINNASIFGDQSNIAGFVGQASASDTKPSTMPSEGSWTFENCINNGDVTHIGGGHISGFVNQLQGKIVLTIKDCEQNGKLSDLGQSVAYFTNNSADKKTGAPTTVKEIRFEGTNKVTSEMYTKNGLAATTEAKAEPKAMAEQSSAFAEGSVNNYGNPNNVMENNPLTLSFDESNHLKVEGGETVDFDYSTLSIKVNGKVTISVSTNLKTGEGSKILYVERRVSSTLDYSDITGVTHLGYCTPSAAISMPSYQNPYSFNKYYIPYEEMETVGFGTRYDTDNGLAVIDNTGKTRLYESIQNITSIAYKINLFKNDGTFVGTGVKTVTDVSPFVF